MQLPPANAYKTAGQSSLRYRQLVRQPPFLVLNTPSPIPTPPCQARASRLDWTHATGTTALCSSPLLNTVAAWLLVPRAVSACIASHSFLVPLFPCYCCIPWIPRRSGCCISHDTLLARFSHGELGYKWKPREQATIGSVKAGHSQVFANIGVKNRLESNGRSKF